MFHSCFRAVERTEGIRVQMLGVFAEVERSIIQHWIHAGIARARVRGTKSGNPIGRAKIPARKEAAIRVALAAGDKGMLKIAAEHGVGSGTVQRIKAEMSRANRGLMPLQSAPSRLAFDLYTMTRTR